jgi:hypothetical protein
MNTNKKFTSAGTGTGREFTTDNRRRFSDEQGVPQTDWLSRYYATTFATAVMIAQLAYYSAVPR